MRLFVILGLVLVPLAEIYLFIEMGRVIGGWSVLGLIIATAIIGLAIARLQGWGLLRQAQMDMANGRSPIAAMGHALFLLLAGIFLLVPGFFTDIIGFLLLIPPIRLWLAQRLIGSVIPFDGIIRRFTTPPHENASQYSAGGVIIETSYEVRETDGDDKPSLSH